MSLSTKLCLKIIISTLLTLSIVTVVIFLSTTDRIIIKSDLVDRGTDRFHIISLINSTYTIISLILVILLLFKDKLQILCYVKIFKIDYSHNRNHTFINNNNNKFIYI